MTTTTCTVVVSATGAKCGDRAVHTFVGTDGHTVYGECAAHTTAHIVGRGHAAHAGDHVTVRRHGKDYDAVVDRVTRTGRVWATVTYDNGVTRTVPVDA
jgi:hypothetical protein